jgi:FkbM family methyltransferase
VVSVEGGSRMLVSTHDSIGRVLAISGVWEPNVTAAFRRHLASGDVCVDVGAHIGYFTLLASQLVGSQGHVYALEPSPANYEALRRNLERNAATNVTALQVAAGERTDRAVLHEGPGTNTGRATLRSVLPNRSAIEGPGVMVDVRPVLACVPEHDHARIRVIKIDVEGYELEVLRSLEPLFDLGEPLAVFLEFNSRWSGESDATEYLERLCREQGFKVQHLRSNYSLQGLFPAEPEEPETVDEIPARECDLLLIR